MVCSQSRRNTATRFSSTTTVGSRRLAPLSPAAGQVKPLVAVPPGPAVAGLVLETRTVRVSLRGGAAHTATPTAFLEAVWWVNQALLHHGAEVALLSRSLPRASVMRGRLI
jgi:hypothetical protein